VRSPATTPVRALAMTSGPAIVPRSGWNADESIRRGEPRYADSLRFASVHHTAGANSYTRAQAPAVVRAIELYHVKGNGWNDIGYNFLVDRFGTVYEGRFGGIDRNVIGAHALGFNTGSVGVAVMGTYGDAAPPQPALDALARLLAWRLDIAHVDPLSQVPVVSGGSERYTAGKIVTLRAISGHRDTGLTACPGDALYGRLDSLAASAAAIGLPKIYEPVVSGEVGGLVRFQARLSSARPWTVTVTDPSGVSLASGSGVGTSVDWTWDATTAPPGGFQWQIATDGAMPATGAIPSGGTTGTPAVLALADVTADSATVSPNGDGVADSATVTYRTTASATVAASVLDAAGAIVETLLEPTQQPAGSYTLTFGGDGLPDGRYTARIDAADAETSVSKLVEVAVTRTLGDLTVTPKAFSPNGDGRADRLTGRFTLLNPAAVRVRVLRDGHWVATPFEGDLPAGRRQVDWDGAKRVGKLLDGTYTLQVEATDAVATAVLGQEIASDTRAPVVRILAGAPLRIWVSEPAVVTIRVNGHVLKLTARGGLAERVPWRRGATHVWAVAWDAAGNVSRPALRG
jgi:flagellar hook assembly protein FlgD